MSFQTKYLPGLTLLDHTKPRESDPNSVTSTIPTENQIKRSKNDPVQPVNTNDGYHLVSSSSSTQPKIKSVVHAPPHLIRYSHIITPQDPPGHCTQTTAPPAKKFPVKITIRQPQQYVPAPNDVEVQPEPNDTLDLELTTPPVLASTLEWTEVTRARPMVKSIQKYPQSSNDNDYHYDFNDDDDFIPILTIIYYAGCRETVKIN